MYWLNDIRLLSYRKPTFTGLYLSWNAFAPKFRKVILIKYLIFRALKICSDNKIKSEFEQIKHLFLGNGYPEEVIVLYCIVKKMPYHNDTIIKTQEDFFINIFTTHFIVRVRKGLLRVCV